MHQPVMVSEVLHFFENRELKVFVDGTLGAGGHSRALLKDHPEIETLIGFDQDSEALKIAMENLEPWRDKVRVIHSSFRNLKSYVGSQSVSGILLDLGISSMQLDSENRGFSFLRDAPLDMRMDFRNKLTAQKVVNSFSEKELADIFFELGEERRSRVVAKAICESRKKKKIETVFDLLEILNKVLKRRGKIHPATLVFQALRLFVNDELGSLKEGLEASLDSLAMGGRIGVISFHSLEDRIVKNSFKQASNFEVLTKKPLTAKWEEVKKNPRARSAKLRFGERV